MSERKIIKRPFNPTGRPTEDPCICNGVNDAGFAGPRCTSMFRGKPHCYTDIGACAALATPKTGPGCFRDVLPLSRVLDGATCIGHLQRQTLSLHPIGSGNGMARSMTCRPRSLQPRTTGIELIGMNPARTILIHVPGR